METCSKQQQQLTLRLRRSNSVATDQCQNGRSVMPAIGIFIMLAAVTSAVRAQRLYPYGGYNPPAVTFRGSATLLSPAEAAAAQSQAQGAARYPSAPPPLRLNTAYSFGDRNPGGAVGPYDVENYLYDSERSAGPPQTHASLITRYQPVHDLPVESTRKFSVPSPYASYVKPESPSPYSTERQFASASSTSATFAERPANLIRPIYYGYSYGSKYNNLLTGLPPLQLASRGAEPGFYGKKPDHPGLKSRSLLTSRGDIAHYKDTPIVGFFGKS